MNVEKPLVIISGVINQIPAADALFVDNELIGAPHVRAEIGDGGAGSAGRFSHGDGVNESGASLAEPGVGGSFSAYGVNTEIAGSAGITAQGSYGDGIPPGVFAFGDYNIVKIGDFDVGAAMTINGLDIYYGSGAGFCTPNAAAEFLAGPDLAAIIAHGQILGGSAVNDSFSDLQIDNILNVGPTPIVTITADTIGGSSNIKITGDGTSTVAALMGAGYTITNGQIILQSGFNIDVGGGADQVQAGSNNDFPNISYYAQLPGAAGNAIYIQYIEDGVAGHETVDVVGTHIAVHIGNTTVLPSTAQQIVAAFNGTPAAYAMAHAVYSGGSNIQHGEGNFLSGGVDAAYASFSGVPNNLAPFNVYGEAGFHPTNDSHLFIDEFACPNVSGDKVPLIAPQSEGSGSVMAIAGLLELIDSQTIPGVRGGGMDGGILMAGFDPSGPGLTNIALVCRQSLLGGDPGTLYLGSYLGQYEFDGGSFAGTGQGNIIAGTASLQAPQQEDFDTSIGSIVSSQPFIGASYKKVAINMQSFTSAGGYVYTFPVPFNRMPPYVYGDAAAVAAAVVTGWDITITSAVAITGNIFIEGS